MSGILGVCPGKTIMNQPLHTIVTHAGSFHADEIMAIALLEKFYLLRPVRVARNLEPTADVALVVNGLRPQFQPRLTEDGLEDNRQPHWIVRTRNPDMLAAARQNASTFVLDVGGELNAPMLNFDHHQSSMKETWKDGTPYSSTGLAWRWLRDQGHLSSLSQEEREEIEATLIRPLDAHDNGVAVCNEAMVVEGFNRHDHDPEQQLFQFEKSLVFLREVLDNNLYRCQVKLESRAALSKAWDKALARGEDFVILNAPLPSRDGTKLLDAISGGRAQLLGVPGTGNRYSLISLKGSKGTFSTRCPVPEDWRGRMDFQASTAKGPVKVAFAHKNGFMCVVEGGWKAAHAVAWEVVRANKAQQEPASQAARTRPARP